MHGLVNRAIQLFVTDTHGRAAWEETCLRAGLDFVEFEPMMRYEVPYTGALIEAAVACLGRPRAALLEDFGTSLVTNPAFGAVRRLLRFGGVTFPDFLHSLDDLPDRVRLAIPDLHLPPMTLQSGREDLFLLRCQAPIAGFGHVMLGLLQAMADDYGALALLDHQGSQEGVECLSITLVQADFAEGRQFQLGQGA